MTGATAYLIAADLDRTLIYSPRSTTQLGGALPADVVEWHGGRVISEMATTVAAALRGLPDTVAFMPATTRTVAQLKRIALPVRPRFAVAASGGVVLERGRPDPEWAARTVSNLQLCAPVAQIRSLLDQLQADGSALRVYTADDLFCYAIVDPAVFHEEQLRLLAAVCAPLSWRVAHQGSKVYVLPDVLHKAHAVDYVAGLLEAETGTRPTVFAAGDTRLDWEMLLAADAGWVPAGSELASSGLTAAHVTHTAEPGHLAAAQMVSEWAGRSR